MGNLASYLSCQDTYYVGHFKGIGKVYDQVYMDAYTRVADCKLYTEKTAITSVDMLNDRVIPWYEQQGVPILRILTDRETEYKGKLENHAYKLFLSVEGISHSMTRAYSRQSNGICGRFNRTIKQEFFDGAMCKKIYRSIEELQTDLDVWLAYYNGERRHSGRYCYGKRPLATLVSSKHLSVEKDNEMMHLKDSSDSYELGDRRAT